MRASSGRRQFECSGPRSICRPKTTVIEGVLASEKKNIWEHGRTFIRTLVVVDRVPCASGTLRPRSPHNLSVLVKRPLNRERSGSFLQESYVYRLTEACQRDTKPMLCPGWSGARGLRRPPTTCQDRPASSLWACPRCPRDLEVMYDPLGSERKAAHAGPRGLLYCH